MSSHIALRSENQCLGGLCWSLCQVRFSFEESAADILLVTSADWLPDILCTFLSSCTKQILLWCRPTHGPSRELRSLSYKCTLKSTECPLSPDWLEVYSSRTRTGWNLGWWQVEVSSVADPQVPWTVTYLLYCDGLSSVTIQKRLGVRGCSAVCTCISDTPINSRDLACHSSSPAG